MGYAAESRDPKEVTKLLEFFVSEGKKACFAATLYACYDLLKPAKVMELAWRNGMTDFAMPYMIQVLHEYTEKVDGLAIREGERKEAEEEAQGESVMMQSQLMLTGASGFVPQGQQGFGGVPQAGATGLF